MFLGWQAKQSNAQRRAAARLKKALFAGACAAAASGYTRLAAAQCNEFADVDGGILFYTNPNFQFDRFSGEVENASFDAIGYLRAKFTEATTPTIGIYLLQNPAGSLLDTSNWRSVRFLSGKFGSTTNFSATGIKYTPAEIPDGGVGRYRSMVWWTSPCTGRVHLKNLKPFGAEPGVKVGTDATGDVYTGIVGDVDPKPSTKSGRKYLGLGRPEFDPALTGAAANTETLEYYSTVRTRADGTGPTIVESLKTLQAFKDRYFPRNVGKELVAKYYNDGDLGVGREMHCNFELPGERACYVSNYAPCTEALQPNGRCAKPKFGDRAGAIAQQLNNKVPFATVAMVERTNMDHTKPNSMFFAVFACTGTNCTDLSHHTLFNGPVALDNHGVAGSGSNTFNPGNCMSCHGTGGSYDKTTNSVTGAYFLPFDMEAFEYLSSEPTSPLSKNGVHDTMRAMNKGVAESHLAKVGNAKRMIDVWYDGTGNYATGTFNGARSPSDLGFVSTTVAGATTHQASGALYTQVYGAACRGCHITHPTLQFSTFSFWQAAAATLVSKVCTTNEMPLAERTHDLVWDEPVRQRLLQHLGITTTACNPPAN